MERRLANYRRAQEMLGGSHVGVGGTLVSSSSYGSQRIAAFQTDIPGAAVESLAFIYVCTLLLTADSLDEQGATLSAARILAVNEAQGTASLVSLPTDLALTVDGGQTTLAELFSSEGYAACVVPVASAAGVSFSNVVLATSDVLEEAASLAGQGTADLVSSASGLLSRIRTNMDATGLLSLAESLSAIGVSNLSASDAPLVAEMTTDEGGNAQETGRQVLDQTQLGLALGTLAPAN